MAGSIEIPLRDTDEVNISHITPQQTRDSLLLF